MSKTNKLHPCQNQVMNTTRILLSDHVLNPSIPHHRFLMVRKRVLELEEVKTGIDIITVTRLVRQVLELGPCRIVWIGEDEGCLLVKEEG